ncbi:energy transducer TonB [Lacihabitans sp. LS3-19]|uniref:energy transducer TonB n=1 Tax=Lacihabitans sp. LS3-19 TaxID=2487335 RepID=UPI0020CFC33E|nr:energy transducer TonB [Lacihabitans sp. LS3-19]MCP9767577.1 energy transducer TonB [Lacihabitans sp. LS3-19]
MRNILALILIPILSFSKPIEMAKDTTNAQFPGGTSEMYKHIAENLKMPQKFMDANISGKIVVSFRVKKEGTIDNIEILRSPGFGIDEEIIKVFKSMPKWIPAKLNGVAIDSFEKIPIACLKQE